MRPNAKALNISAKATSRVLQSGWHNVWDITADAWAKRTCIAEAMAEMNIDGYNLHLYEQQAKQ